MRKLFCVLIVAMMLFSVVSCNKQKSEFSDNVKIQFDENLTIEDIENELKKHGYVNALDRKDVYSVGSDGSYRLVEDIRYKNGYAYDCWIPSDIFELDSGTYDIIVYGVSVTEPRSENENEGLRVREIPTKVTIAKEYQAYYRKHSEEPRLYLDLSIVIENVYALYLPGEIGRSEFVFQDRDGEKIPLEFK